MASDTKKFECGASTVSSSWAVTTATCLAEKLKIGVKPKSKKPSDLYVLTFDSSTGINVNHGTERQMRTVLRIQLYPKFKSQYYVYNLGILKVWNL